MTYERFPQDVKVGEKILIDDGIKYDDNKVLKADDSKNRNWYLNLAFLF